MHSRYARFFQFIIVLGDLLLLNGSFLLALAFRFDEIKLQNTQYYDYYVQLAVFFNISWLFLSLLFKTYDTKRTLVPRKATAKVLNAFSLHFFILLLLLVSLKKDEYSRLFLIYFYASFFVTILPWRFYFLRFLIAARRRGTNFRSVVLIGNGPALVPFYQSVLDHPEFGLRVVGYFSNNPIVGIPLKGSEKEAANFIVDNKVAELFCAYAEREKNFSEWYKFADENMLRFRIVPDLGVHHATSVAIDYHHDVPILVQRKEPLELLHNRWLKRGIDVIFSLSIIVFLFPILFPLLALGVKLSGKGPVFFKQKRSGLRDDGFSIYKFRSMMLNAEADLKQATNLDNRITAFGRFIRKHSLDELPQFFNVLKGDMSVIGPRPHMLAHTEQYRVLVNEYMVRHLAKPGITGLAQIKGYRGETGTTEQMLKRVQADVYYIENWSLLLDLKIVMLTVFQVFKGFKSEA